MVRGTKRALKNEVPHMHKEVKFSIHNRFDVEVIDAVTGEVKQKAFAENIVLDALWTRLLAPNTYFNYIHYGTGTGILAASRTSLFTFLGAKEAASKVLTYNWENGWISSRKQCQITETEYIGSELKEVGIGYGVSSGNLVTHALLKDMNGNAITILKTSTDIINIYATVFVYWNITGYDSGAITIGYFGDNHFLTKFLAGDYDSNSVPNALAFLEGEPHFVFDANSNTSISNTEGCIAVKKSLSSYITYSVANKKIAMSTVRLAAAEGNGFAGIKTVIVAVHTASVGYRWIPIVCFKVPGTFFEKSTITGESIGTGDGTTKKFKTVHQFVKSGWKIYIDGIQQTSGVTVSEGLPFTNTKMGEFFKFVSTNHDPLKNTMPSPVMKFGLPQANSYAIYYNPYYSYGIDSFKCKYSKVESSDDLVTWTTHANFPSYEQTITVTAAAKNHRYWRITSHSGSDVMSCYNFTSGGMSSTNIAFDAAPSLGAVITAEYDCEVVAKDANHVFDFSFEIQLAEKTS